MVSEELKSLGATLLRNITIVVLMRLHSDELPVLIKSLDKYSTEHFFSNNNTIKYDEVVLNEILNQVEQLMTLEKIQLTWNEILVCKDIEAFDYYVSQMMTKLFLQRPETVRSSEFTVPMSEILQCSSIEEILRNVVEKKVQDLSYKGFEDIIKYLNEKLHLGFNTKDLFFQDICEMYQVRNIIVHNATRINETYHKRTNRTDLKIGDLYPLNEAYTIDRGQKLIHVSKLLDDKLTSHFKIN